MLGFAALAALAGSLFVHASWATRRDRFIAVGRSLEAVASPVTDRVMSIDAGGIRYWTGHGGVVLVNDPLATIEQVARAYDIRWLVLDRGDSVESLAPVLDGGPRPAWLGAPVLAEGDPLRLAVYPVEAGP